jgi:uncharacterized protein (TIGR04255 family)
MNSPAMPFPNYKNPPVAEVALSVQFEPLNLMKTGDLGNLWSLFRKSGFSRTEDHRPLDAFDERFDPRAYVQETGILFRTLDPPPMPRVWFLNEQGTELVQVQRDRFIHNWRKLGSDVDYVRYPRIREKFRTGFSEFESFVSTEGLGTISPNQCEVTYTNHLLSGEGWDRQGDLARIFSFWNPVDGGFLPSIPEHAAVSIRHLIPDSSGKHIGRLHIEAQPAFRNPDFRPMIVLTLTARGTPIGLGADGVMAFLDLGREWIVRGFTSITTQEMHTRWGRVE